MRQPSSRMYSSHRLMKSTIDISAGTLPRRASSTRTVSPAGAADRGSPFQTPWPPIAPVPLDHAHPVRPQAAPKLLLERLDGSIELSVRAPAKMPRPVGHLLD